MGGGKSKFVLYLYFCSRRYFFGALEMVWSVIRTEVTTNIQLKNQTTTTNNNNTTMNKWKEEFSITTALTMQMKVEAVRFDGNTNKGRGGVAGWGREEKCFGKRQLKRKGKGPG